MRGSPMQEHASQYLERATDYEAKAKQAEDPLMKKTYEELQKELQKLDPDVPLELPEDANEAEKKEKAEIVWSSGF